MAATRLKQIRESRGLTQVQLSVRARVAVRTIATAEAGRTKPQRRLQARLAQALRVPMAELFPETSDGTPETPLASGL